MTVPRVSPLIEDFINIMKDWLMRMDFHGNAYRCAVYTHIWETDEDVENCDSINRFPVMRN
jgi:hypothetical protein